jgi:hypothetical protein
MKKMKKKLEVEYSCYSDDDVFVFVGVLKVDDDNHDGGRDERWKMSGTK